ncbi:MAG TPA: branched-chain amino acid aminotransferase [Bacteroidia bacterium]|jgi:branched-chain amino acid aminotransferase|nr:branched-chain amino acid aminotransferase [Bacteroidia bacterium]
MITADAIKIKKITKSRISEVDFNDLEFGKVISDHMVVSDYRDGEWNSLAIEPFGEISFTPTILALHYGQMVFEGMKAFRRKDGNVSLFRIEKHYERFIKSLERMCMPVMSYRLFEEGLVNLVQLDAAWVPNGEGSALYIRPFAFASEERFGVKISAEYKYIIFTGPVGPYYDKPLRVKVEDHYVRAARGGTGSAKCAGNYGASFYPAHLAKMQGFDQVLWTDGSPELNIEESGTMNVMFVIDGVLVTPPLSDSILDGVTRDSFLTLAHELGVHTQQRTISALELENALEKNILQEAFGTGTAAVATYIQSIDIKGKDYSVPVPGENGVMTRIKNLLTDIRTGKAPDKYKWNTVIDCK